MTAAAKRCISDDLAWRDSESVSRRPDGMDMEVGNESQRRRARSQGVDTGCRKHETSGTVNGVGCSGTHRYWASAYPVHNATERVGSISGVLRPHRERVATHGTVRWSLAAETGGRLERTRRTT